MEKSAGPRPAATPVAWQPVANPNRPVVEKPDKWRAITKGTYLPLVNRASLTLNQGIIDLLELTPTEWKEINGELETLIDNVRTVELEKAYVRVKSDGSEEIVVAPFDRKPMIDKFRATVASQLGNNVADFLAEQVLYDAPLALGNAEVSIGTEKWIDGKEKQVIHCTVRRKKPSDDPNLQGQAALLWTTTMVAEKDLGLRFRHLSTAATTLPRKEAAPKAP